MSSSRRGRRSTTGAPRGRMKMEETYERITPSVGKPSTIKSEAKEGAMTKTVSPSKTATLKRPLEDSDSDAEPERPAKKAKPPKPEKRLRRFRPKPPTSFQDNYDRARTQRFFVLSRNRGTTIEVDGAETPAEEIELAGSTGNVYKVVIKRMPTCTCPHYAEGNQCKHWLYVMERVLRAKFEHVYQLALLSTELQEVLDNAPALESETTADTKHPEKRKLIEGDCPICYSEFEEHEKQGDAIVWCRAACGQNIHRTCFQTWASTKCPGRESEATCPYCRSVWGVDEDLIKTKKVRTDGPLNEDGYVNVADQLGISQSRDYSSYHTGWGGWSSYSRSRSGWRGGSRGWNRSGGSRRW